MDTDTTSCRVVLVCSMDDDVSGSIAQRLPASFLPSGNENLPGAEVAENDAIVTMSEMMLACLDFRWSEMMTKLTLFACRRGENDERPCLRGVSLLVRCCDRDGRRERLVNLLIRSLA